jgi:glutamyl/glutaminyl-tRNA synthetase
MRLLNLALLLLFQNNIGYCQNNQTQDTGFIKEVLIDSFSIKDSYKSLPKFIQEYLTKVNKRKFVIRKKRFNTSDINVKESTSRKLSYVGVSKNFYILSYDHGGKGHHHHSIIFSINAHKVNHVYNLITPIHKTTVELKPYLENRLYSFQTLDEI